VPDIRHFVLVAAPPEAVFPFIATGEGFKQWWAEDVVIDPSGPIRLGFFKRATVYVLRRDASEPSRRVTWRCESGEQWAGTWLVFDLEERGSQTAVIFTHAGWRQATEFFTSCNTTWGELLYRLKAAAEGKAPGPLFGTERLLC